MSTKRGRGRGRGRPRGSGSRGRGAITRRSRYQDDSDTDSEFGNEFFDFSDITLKKPIPKIGLPVTSDEDEKQESFDLLVKSEPEDYDSQKEEIREGHWSLKEKRALLEGLKKFGFHDYENIKTYVQTRSTSDIKTYISNTRTRVKNSLAAQGLEAPQDPVKANMENWRRLVISKIEPRYKNDDFSQVLSEIMDEASKGPFPKPDGTSLPDFAAIYRYLRDVLAGKMPGALSPIDSWVLSQILQSIFEMAAGMDTSEEEAFLTRIVDEATQPKPGPSYPSSSMKRKRGGRRRLGPEEVAERMKGYLKWLNPLEIPPSQLAALKHRCQSWLHGASCDEAAGGAVDDAAISAAGAQVGQEEFSVSENPWLNGPQEQGESSFPLFGGTSDAIVELTAEEPVPCTLSSHIDIELADDGCPSLLLSGEQDVDMISIEQPS